MHCGPDSLIHRHLSIFRAGNEKTWADSERKEVGPKAASRRNGAHCPSSASQLDFLIYLQIYVLQ